MADIERTKKSSCSVFDDWAKTCETNPDHVFSDPLYGAQKWAYDLLNVEPVWRAGITGKGVVIRVNDPDGTYPIQTFLHGEKVRIWLANDSSILLLFSGVDVDHPEFADRFSAEASCDVYLPQDYEKFTHGTAVASLALAGHNNGLCAVGIAPEATLSACLGPTELTDANAAKFFNIGIDKTHISVNAWGFDAWYVVDAVPIGFVISLV
jgi:subtilisin family serine protease